VLSILLFKNKKIKHTICRLLNRFSITEEIARKSSQGFFKPKDLFSIYFHLKYLINTLRIFINQLLTSKTLIWFQNTKLNWINKSFLTLIYFFWWYKSLKHLNDLLLLKRNLTTPKSTFFINEIWITDYFLPFSLFSINYFSLLSNSRYWNIR